MPVRATCPAGHTMLVPDHRAGTNVRCARCGVPFIVPGDPPAERGALLSDGEGASGVVATATDPVVRASKAAVVPPPVPTTKEAAPATKAWIPPRDQGDTAFSLALMLAALAIFGVSPAVWEWFVLWQHPDSPPIPPWVYALLVTAVVQLAYAVYLAQMPDWSALWTTTIATLLAAAAWATLLGTTLLGKQESMLVLLFRYADKLEGNRAAMWCFIMLCFTSVFAYFLGFTASRWHRSYLVLRTVHGE